MFHRWTSERACIHIASPGVAMTDMRYSLPEICCESQHLSTSMHLCLNYSSQTASTPGTSSHSSQAHMVLLVYLFAYLFPSLLLEKESCYKDKNGLNLPSICSSLPSAEIPGCVSNQVFASLSINHLLGETVPDSLLKKMSRHSYSRDFLPTCLLILKLAV